MKRDEYLKMLLQDVEGEKEPEKELYEAVLECTAEAISQMLPDFEVDAKIGIDELWKAIRDKGRESKAKCVSPFTAAEIIAENLERIMSGRSISFVLYSEMLRRLRCIVWRI